jgi:penicillin-binding protein 1A
MRWSPLITGILSLSALAGAFFLGLLVFISHDGVLDFSPLERSVSARPTIVLDDKGVEWTRFQLDRRDPILFSVLPKHLVNAFVAAEDWDFFSHKGISWKGIVRSTFVNLYHRRIVQGASTITQQLVKLLFFDAQRTFKRKIKEQVYALLLEQRYSKEYIMQLYLNNVYFGCGIYGVEAASHTFWGKSVSDLTVDEAAVLAGIVRSPGSYCPLLHPEGSAKRRNAVLAKMAHLNFIAESKLGVYKAKPLILVTHAVDHAAHVKEMLRQFLEERFGRQKLYTGGMVVKTTLNTALQSTAEKAFKNQIDLLRTTLRDNVDGGLVSFDPQTGAIKALVGGYNFKESQFNRVVQTSRQIGSLIKPLVYAAALEQGKTFADTLIDEPLNFEQPNGTIWSPKNYNLKFEGRMTLARALYRSNNIVAIKTLLETGYDRVLEVSRQCHIQGPFNRYPSLALGCLDGTLNEVTAFFNVFANNGRYVEPYAVEWVKDIFGTKIYRHERQEIQVLSPLISGQVTKVLMLALKMVRKWYPAGAWLETEAISKTGTTNDCRTNWYIGSTPELTTGIYIGCDDNTPLGKNSYPLRTAFPIWLHVQRAFKYEHATFVLDPRLQMILVDEMSGRRVSQPGDGVIEIAIA